MTPAAHRIDKLVVVGVGLIGGSFALAQKAAGAAGTIVGVGRGRVNLEEAREPRHHRPRRAARRRLDARARDDRHRAARDAGRAVPRAVRDDGAASRPAHDRHRRRQHQAGRHRRRARDARRRTAAIRARPSDRRHRAVGRGGGVLDALRRSQRRADAAAGDRSARARDGRGRCGRPAARACARSTPPRTTACSPRCRTCRTCSRSRSSTSSPRAPTRRSCSASRRRGFRDFTRIAASSPEMWRDIALANRDALLARDRRVPRRSSIASLRWSPPAMARALEAVFASRQGRAPRLGFAPQRRAAGACRKTARASPDRRARR